MPMIFQEKLKTYDYIKSANIIIISAYLIVTFVVMILRIQYPYQLEWMEGGEIEHILRLLKGKSIYCPPSMEFIPYIYTPLYYYIGVLFSPIFEPSLLLMRVVSVISFLISLIFIYLIIYRLTNDKYYGVVGVGIYALSFATTGFWFDTARVDTVANLFMILSFYFLLGDKKFSYIFSALFSFLAFYSKQSYVIITLFIIVSLFITKNKKFALFSLIYFGLIVCSTLVESILSNGWYLFWNFYFPSTHHWIWERAITFWTIDTLPFYSVSLAFILAFLLVKKSKIFSQGELFFFALFIGCWASSYFSRLHYGGYLNVLIPFISSISLLFPIALSSFERELKNIEMGRIILHSSLFIQLLLLLYNPIFPVPNEKDRQDVERILSFAKNKGAEVYLMGYNYVQGYYGLKSYPHYVLVNDLLISKVAEKQAFVEEFKNSLKTKKFKYIILDSDLHLDFLANYYVKTDTVFFHRVFNSKNSPIRKEVVWVPKN